jgi:hypothetical protein
LEHRWVKHPDIDHGTHNVFLPSRLGYGVLVRKRIGTGHWKNRLRIYVLLAENVGDTPGIGMEFATPGTSSSSSNDQEVSCYVCRSGHTEGCMFIRDLRPWPGYMLFLMHEYIII